MSLVCLSSANCLQAFLCIIFRWGFFLGRQPCRTIWCSVRRMVWELTGWPPTPSTSAAMLAALIRLFPKQNVWIWRWACALNYFGRLWPVLSETYPVKPLYGVGHHAAAQFQFLGNFFRSSESYLPWGAMLNFQWPVWEIESDNTKLNTPVPIHTWDLVTLTWHQGEKMANRAQFGHFHIGMYFVVNN